MDGLAPQLPAGATGTEVLGGGRPGTPAWLASAVCVSLLGSEVAVCPEGWASSFLSRQQASRAWGGDQVPSRELSVAWADIPTSASRQVAGQPLPQGPAGHHVGCPPVVLLVAPESSSEVPEHCRPLPQRPGHPQRCGP